MCSKSNVNEALKGMTTSGDGAGGSVPSIAAHHVRQNRSTCFLVDIREEAEIKETPFADADAQMSLGAICHNANDVIAKSGDKTMVLVCNTDSRATLAAQSIQTQNAAVKVAVLQRGLVGWNNMAAVAPDFLVVLGLGDSSEKLSLSLAAVASAVELHATVVLVLMSDGVTWFLNADSPKWADAKTKLPSCENVEAISHGEPFKPCKAMLQKFLSSGGIVLACTTCIKSRGYSFDSDMMNCIHPLQMPDLIRMMGEAKGGCLQFM